MNSGVAPLLIGFAAIGVLLIPIGMFFAARRLFERMRLRPRRGEGRGSEGQGADQGWVYRPRAQGDAGAEPPSSKARTGTGDPSPERQDDPALLRASLARRRTTLHFGSSSANVPRVRWEEDEPPHGAKDLPAVEQHRDAPLPEGPSNLVRSADVITDDTQRQAREVLEKAELEAQAVVAAAHDERTRILGELARECAAVEETRTKLSGFLAGVLDEIDATPSVHEPSADVHVLSEARDMKTAARADQ